MPLISPVEAKATKYKFAILLLYFVLVIGAITMIYPFGIMLASSITSEPDYQEYRLIPRYLYKDGALYKKYVTDAYNRRYWQQFRYKYRVEKITSFLNFEKMPQFDAHTRQFQELVNTWKEFRKTVPEIMTIAAFSDVSKLTSFSDIQYQKWLRAIYHDDIQAFNTHAAYNRQFKIWEHISIKDNFPHGHKYIPPFHQERKHWLDFKANILDPDKIQVFSYGAVFLEDLERKFGTLDSINEVLKTKFKSVYDIQFPTHAPTNPTFRKFWEDYLVKDFPVRFLEIAGEHSSAYQKFLKARFKNIQLYNRLARTNYSRFEDIRFPLQYPGENDFEFNNWSDFVDRMDLGFKRVLTVEGEYQRYLMSRFGTVEKFNQAFGKQYETFEAISPPWQEVDFDYFVKNKKMLKTEYLLRNYRAVMVYLSTQAYAFKNTIILVLLTLIGQMTVSSMAAFALSRYRLSYTHKIMLFCIATMAFPGEVSMIPNFLLLKELDLLNTFAALVLPGLTSGMGIFYLKGYFDSLPSELYEAGMIDGASEMRMFVQITLPLSKPILAVTALGAFNGAYGSFLWAYLICQKQEMWTMMVAVQQWTGWNSDIFSQPFVMAALVIAGVPTLLVFIFCQRTIMRGIIIPTMK